jgi:arylsulfatase A-like enzyme
MTDNGYANGIHRLSTKRCEYEECIGTPLLIRYPSSTPRTVTRIASNVDIAPTVAELAGATPTRTQDGYSLVPLVRNQTVSNWANDTQGFLIHYTGFGTANDPSPVPGYWGVRAQRFKYVELSTGEKELYDLQSDPYELENLAGQAAYMWPQGAMAQKLQALKER